MGKELFQTNHQAHLIIMCDILRPALLWRSVSVARLHMKISFRNELQATSRAKLITSLRMGQSKQIRFSKLLVAGFDVVRGGACSLLLSFFFYLQVVFRKLILPQAISYTKF